MKDVKVIVLVLAVCVLALQGVIGGDAVLTFLGGLAIASPLKERAPLA